MSKFFSLSLVAVVVAGGLTLYWRWPAAVPEAQPATTVAVPSRQSLIEQASTSPAKAPAEAQPSIAVTLPSLAGTEVDGQLRTDAAGNLLLDLAVRDYFDYFLSAVDHSGLDAVIEALLAEIGRAHV